MQHPERFIECGTYFWGDNCGETSETSETRLFQILVSLMNVNDRIPKILSL